MKIENGEIRFQKCQPAVFASSPFVLDGKDLPSDKSIRRIAIEARLTV